MRERASRPAVRVRQGVRWGLRAIAVGLVVSIPIGCQGAAPTASPTVAPQPSIVVSSSPSVSSIATASPRPTTRHLEDVVFKEIPSWLVPAGGTPGVSTFGNDGTWSTAYTVPRAPGTVADEFQAALTAQGIEVKRTDASATSISLHSQGVLPSIQISVEGKDGGTEVTVALNRNEL
jgi:hypothetical protein